MFGAGPLGKAPPFLMDLTYRVLSDVRSQPPAPGEGLRLGIWQGTGTAATPEAVAENLERLERVCQLAAPRGCSCWPSPSSTSAATS